MSKFRLLSSLKAGVMSSRQFITKVSFYIYLQIKFCTFFQKLTKPLMQRIKHPKILPLPTPNRNFNVDVL